MRIRYISSPSADHLLTPDEYRRYTNHIVTYFAIFFVSLSYIIGLVLFNNGYEFWSTFSNIRSNNQEELSKIMVSLFYTKCAIDFIPSYFIASWLTKKLTKPINRQTHKLGNFLDDSNEVFENLQKDFSDKSTGNTMALIRKGDIDYNKKWDGTEKMPQAIFLPNEILELSFIIRGEAGSGKSVVLDRLTKESIDNGHKVITHDAKGDFIEKLEGYTSFYVIEPWNDKRGYALDFLNMLVSPNKAIQNANIRTLVDSFSVAIDGKESFFDKGSVSVMEAVVRCVVESNLDVEGNVTEDIGGVPKIWNSFNVKNVDLNVDTTDPVQTEKELKKNDDQLQIIKEFLMKWNPSATIYIDPENAKTSLCVLASCIELIRKFEFLSSFWESNIKKGKVLNIKKWLNTPPGEDRPVIVLVNSNQFEDVANCYISAFINLTVNEVIEERYKAPWELHFMLDEFPQLKSIDLNKFLKLPDVGRGKLVRVMLAMQRSSQIKASFNMDGESFVAAFQNKIWCRMASDDLPVIERELGRRDISETASTSNYNSQGQSSSGKTTNTKVDVINAHDMQNNLGPIFLKKLGPNGRPIFCGVKVLFKFSNIRRVAVAIMPPVKFDKKEKYLKSKNTASSNISSSKKDGFNDESKEEITIDTKVIEHIETQSINAEVSETESENPAQGALMSEAAHAIGGEALVAVMHMSELMDSLESHSLNNNITEVVHEVVEEKLDISKKIQDLKNKTRKNKDMDI